MEWRGTLATCSYPKKAGSSKPTEYTKQHKHWKECMRQLAETTGPCYLQSTHRSRYTYLCANISSPYCWFPVTLSPCFQLTMSTTRARHQHIHVPAQEHKQKPPKPPFRLRTRGCVWWCTFFCFFFSSLVFLCLAADLRNPKQSENTCFRMRNSGPSCRRSDRIGEGVDMG